jgi:hypothetical protein
MGTASQQRWAQWLASYLPIRYRVESSAFVVDSGGMISEEQDIVIFDRQYTPFLLKHDGATYIPAEGVYAVFEVKQDLSGSTLQYAAKKAKSVRQLTRTSVRIPSAGGLLPAKRPPRILSGLLTLGCSWSNDKWIRNLKAAARNLSSKNEVDLICALERASVLIRYGRTSPLLETSTESLVFFYFSLLQGLQEVATVPAMKLSAYRVAIPVFRH